MNPDHPRFAEWDAAYVLGALSPSDRHEFEAHLDECPECRRAVAWLTPTAGLLSRLSADDADRIDRDAFGSPADDDGSPHPVQVLESARHRSRRRRRVRVVALVAAAVLVVTAIAVPLSVTSVLPSPARTFALESTTGVPLQASVELTSVGWGTRIELTCRYPRDDESDAPEDGWAYALTVVDSSGEASDVSTWRSRPGSTARLEAGTALELADISRVEIRTLSGQVLMERDLQGE
jgi:hypothetical protein